MAEQSDILNKELFYQKMQPYFDAGIVREVYRSDSLCMLSVGEKVYVACPYLLWADHPYGIYMNEKVMLDIAQVNGELFTIIEQMLGDLNRYKRILYYFHSERIDYWKQWIVDNRAFPTKMNPKLEKKLKKLEKLRNGK